MKHAQWTIALAASAILGIGGPAVAAPAASTEAAQPADGQAVTNWFGGPAYLGAPALDATAALVKAGGGAENFDFGTALVSMLGKDTVDAEVIKLNEQYGEKNVQDFISGMTYAIKEGLRLAGESGVELPAPADLHGQDLARALVKAGTAPDGKFWAGYLFDVAVSHDLHVKIMESIDKNFGHDADMNTHRILNQAMYDVAQALDMDDVHLADLH